MRPVVFGQQLAQVHNGDPFAPPVWRAPVYHTPGWITAVVQIARTLWAILRFPARHPLAVIAALALFGAWRLTGWPGPVGLVLIAIAVLAVWRLRWPASLMQWVHRPAVSKWRRWHYARHWDAVMSIARLAVAHRGRVRSLSTGCTDLLRVRLVSGQCPADYANRTDNLAHGFGAFLCRVRTARSPATTAVFKIAVGSDGIVDLDVGHRPAWSCDVCLSCRCGLRISHPRGSGASPISPGI